MRSHKTTEAREAACKATATALRLAVLAILGTPGIAVRGRNGGARDDMSSETYSFTIDTGRMWHDLHVNVFTLWDGTVEWCVNGSPCKRLPRHGIARHMLTLAERLAPRENVALG